MGAVDLHLPVQSVVEEEVVGHPHPMGLHGMTLAVIVVADVAWVRKMIFILIYKSPYS